MTTQALNQPMSGRASRPSTENAAALVLGYSENWPIHILLFRIIGAAMVLSASGMWLMPGAASAPDLVLIKLGMSMFFFLCGLALLMRNHQDTRPEAYFDPIRNEVRVLQKNNRGVPEMVMSRSYDTLGSACFNGDNFELFDPDGAMLMRLPLEDASSREALRQQLSGKVSLT